MDYKNTLNLPRTDFPHEGGPGRARTGTAGEMGKDRTLRENPGRPRQATDKFVLHDGPPFANGDVHIGTALNKILKDIIVKYKTLRGFSAPYVPGWDCHGLPIEFKVSQEMRKAGDTSADAVAIRKACEAYARKYIDIQRAPIQTPGRLGRLGQSLPHAEQGIRGGRTAPVRGHRRKGLRLSRQKAGLLEHPCRTALAEAEVEYKDHVSQSIYVKFPVVGQPKTFVADLDDHAMDAAGEPGHRLQR